MKVVTMERILDGGGVVKMGLRNMIELEVEGRIGKVIGVRMESREGGGGGGGGERSGMSREVCWW